MTSALLPWRRANTKLPPAAGRRVHNGRVAPRPDNDDRSNSTLEAGSETRRGAPVELGVMSSTTATSIISDVESRYSFTDGEVLRAVRQLRIVTVTRLGMPLVRRHVRYYLWFRIVTVVVAVVPLSCLCVIAGVWTSSAATVALTRSKASAASRANSSTAIMLTLCCAGLHPSVVDCWILSELDVDGVDDAQLDVDDQLAATWSNVTASRGCDNVVLLTAVNFTSYNNNCSANASYCADVFCNSSLSTYGGHVESSSSTMWTASGLAALTVLAVVGLVYHVSAATRFHRGRLRSAVAETRAAQSRRRTAADDRSCCDRLLADMLPPCVAERLKSGQTVEPERLSQQVP